MGLSLHEEGIDAIFTGYRVTKDCRYKIRIMEGVRSVLLFYGAS